MLKSSFKLLVFLITSSVFLYFFSGDGYMFYFLFLFLGLSLHYHDRKFRDIYSLSYLILSFWGVGAAASYYVSYGQTFGPYFDDTFYFDNINTIFEGSVKPNSTIYELVVGIIYLPFSLLVNISHLDLLPFNWFIGSLVVVQAMKLAERFYPIKNNDWAIGAFLLIVANSNFINGIVHLYRDGLMAFFLLLCLKNATDRKYFYAICFAILTGLIRGANGALAFLYIILMYIPSRMPKLSKSQIGLFITCFLFIAILGDGVIGYSNYLRSFRGADNSENISMSKQLSRRYDNLEEDAVGGVGEMLTSNNPILMAAALPITMISPIKVKPFISTEKTSVWGWINRFRIESLWEIGNLLLWSFCFYPLILGIRFMLKDTNMKHFGAILFYLISLIAISYVSMQLRHKIGYIVLFPMLFNAYYTHKKKFSKTNARLLKGCIFAVLLLYNVIDKF